MLYFKVKNGYGEDDFVSVDQTELPGAVKAQINGKVMLAREGTVSGNSILGITPDFNRALGYSRAYRMGPEDYKDLGPIRDEHLDLLEGVTRQVRNELGLAPNIALESGPGFGGPTRRIGN